VTRASTHRTLAVLTTTATLLAAADVARAASPSSSRTSGGAAPAPERSSAGAAAPQRLVRDSVAVEFSVEKGGDAGAPMLEGEYADIRFRITDAATGKPLSALDPAAWIDVAGGLSGGAGGQAECREKVGLYLRGLVGIRPMADLNSYFLLVLNGDATISVIDPVVGVTGRTSLYATVLLPRPGADWAKTRDENRLFVSMPLAGQVAAVDAESFKLTGTIAAGAVPTRVALQPDERYLWVGNDGRTPGESGVTVIDPAAMKPVATLATGRGHHEIAFSGDSRRAFVTNRLDGTVSVIDVARLEKVKDLTLGSAPISMAYSPLSESLYVADGKDGWIAVVDPRTLAMTARIEAKPGLGPMRFAEDGRWAVVVNSIEHAVHIVDAGQNRVVHTVPVAGKPYQVAITRGFAYVRHLDTEKVSMLNLLSVGEGKKPIVTSFSAGTGAPSLAGDLAIADAITPASTDAAVFVNNPVEGKTYFYMEGMNAPMGSFSNYGHRTRAVGVIDRSVREVAPGTYAASLRLPDAGKYDVAFLLDNPRVLHCFSLEVEDNPLFSSRDGKVRVEYLDVPDDARAGDRVALRVRLSNPRVGEARSGVRDVQLTWYQPPGRLRQAAIARDVGEGVYEADVSFAEPGPWYLQVTVPSLHAGPGEVPYRSIIVGAAPPRTAGRE
jgi:YVTN family beta-propeller protein